MTEEAVPTPAEKLLESAKREVLLALERREAGSKIADHYSEAILNLVADVAREVGPLPSASCLGAVGSLARQELCPFCDLDLFLLSEDSDAQEEVEEWGKQLAHALWNLGIKVNLSSHCLQSWLDQAGSELDLCTALLDLKLIPATGGKPELVGRVRKQGRERYFGEHRTAFLQRLSEEVEERHRRYGATVYRVEPDLKYGSGGSRDLAVLRWAVEAVQSGDPGFRPEALSAFPERAEEALLQAKDVILRLRCALHLTAQGTQTRLVFPYQDALPGMWNEPVEGELGVASVERMMQVYYQSARDVVRYGKRLFARCLSPMAGVAVPERVSDDFYLVDGFVFANDKEVIQKHPERSLEAIRVAALHQSRLSGEIYDQILDFMARSESRALADSRVAQELFLQLLLPLPESHSPSVLENCLELGILDRMVPEFLPSRGRMQREGFHVYTVDQHSLYAVEFLKALSRGEYRKDYPLATGLFLNLEDHRVLFLATLLHDSGKALGDQCEVGSRIASRVASRLGLGKDESERCGFLVRHHLQMPLLSQKRDLGDALLISEFAEEIGSMKALSELYLLSLADMATVSPSFLTSWKLTLLDELYLQTANHLRFQVQPSSDIENRRIEDEDEPQGLNDRYQGQFDLELRKEHQRFIEAYRSRKDGRYLEFDLSDAAGAMRLTVVTEDKNRVLARITAALDEFGLDVVAADLFTVPGPTPIVLDVFRLVPQDEEEIGPRSWRHELEQRLDEYLAGGKVIDDKIRPSRPGKKRASIFGLKSNSRHRGEETELSFSEDPAGKRSIVELRTPDRPGVLRRIAWAFAEAETDIQLARLGSEGGFVDDVFYVEKLSQANREKLKSEIMALFEES